MKIGVMSDTHLQTATATLKRIVEDVFADTDMILHAGDLVGGPVLAYLESAGVTAVRGNMDYPEVVSALPTKRVIRAGEATIGLIHGFGAPRGLAAELRREFDQIDCLVFGHSHEPLNMTQGDELWFNPGAVASNRQTVGLLTVEGRTVTGRIINVD